MCMLQRETNSGYLSQLEAMIMFYLEPCGSLAFTNSSFIAVEIMFSMASYFFEVITGCVVVYVKVNTPVVVCMPISDCIDVKKKLFMESKKIITYKIKMMPSFYLLL